VRHFQVQAHARAGPTGTHNSIHTTSCLPQGIDPKFALPAFPCACLTTMPPSQPPLSITQPRLRPHPTITLPTPPSHRALQHVPSTCPRKQTHRQPLSPRLRLRLHLPLPCRCLRLQLPQPGLPGCPPLRRLTLRHDGLVRVRGGPVSRLHHLLFGGIPLQAEMGVRVCCAPWQRSRLLCPDAVGGWVRWHGTPRMPEWAG